MFSGHDASSDTQQVQKWFPQELQALLRMGPVVRMDDLPLIPNPAATPPLENQGSESTPTQVDS